MRGTTPSRVLQRRGRWDDTVRYPGCQQLIRHTGVTLREHIFDDSMINRIRQLGISHFRATPLLMSRIVQPVRQPASSPCEWLCGCVGVRACNGSPQECQEIELRALIKRVPEPALPVSQVAVPTHAGIYNLSGTRITYGQHHRAYRALFMISFVVRFKAIARRWNTSNFVAAHSHLHTHGTCWHTALTSSHVMARRTRLLE